MSKESEDDAGTSSLMETTMMEGEDYYNPGDVDQWTDGVQSNQLCRICASSNEYLIPIFDGEGLEHQLGMKIEKHLPIQVRASDKLPLQVCYQCASTLIAWHDLVIGCVTAEKKLLQLREQELNKERESDDNFDDDDSKHVELLEDPLGDLSKPSTSKATVPAKKPTVRSRLRSKKSEPIIQPKTEVSDPETSEATERCQEPTRSQQEAVTDTGLLVCVHCGLLFKRKTQLASHMTNDHHMSVFHCHVCDDLYQASESDFMIHVSNHKKDSTKIPCSVCGKMFRRFDLIRHMKVHNSDKPHTCTVCMQVFPTRYELTSHRKTHFPEPESSSTCTICGRIFTRKYDLQRHMSNLHPGGIAKKPRVTKVNVFPEKSSVCSGCGKEYTRYYDMLRHQKTLHCGNDNDKDNDDDDVTQHTRLPRSQVARTPKEDEVVAKARVIENGQVRYLCPHCNHTIVTRYRFIHHLRIHSGEKPCTCHICGKQFRTTQELSRHVRDVHLRIKNYGCDVCGKKFANSALRNDHTLTHFDKRSFVCHVCGKAYKTRSCLNVHGRFHRESTRKHGCSHCGRKFRTLQGLNAHVRTHTGEKPHPCGMCSKAFRTTTQLKNHILIHTHPNASYECSECHKTFAQARYLREHKRISHKSVAPS